MFARGRTWADRIGSSNCSRGQYRTANAANLSQGPCGESLDLEQIGGMVSTESGRMRSGGCVSGGDLEAGGHLLVSAGMAACCATKSAYVSARRHDGRASRLARAGPGTGSHQAGSTAPSGPLSRGNRCALTAAGFHWPSHAGGQPAARRRKRAPGGNRGHQRESKLCEGHSGETDAQTHAPRAFSGLAGRLGVGRGAGLRAQAWSSLARARAAGCFPPQSSQCWLGRVALGTKRACSVRARPLCACVCVTQQASVCRAHCSCLD